MATRVCFPAFGELTRSVFVASHFRECNQHTSFRGVVCAKIRWRHLLLTPSVWQLLPPALFITWKHYNENFQIKWPLTSWNVFDRRHRVIRNKCRFHRMLISWTMFTFWDMLGRITSIAIALTLVIPMGRSPPDDSAEYGRWRWRQPLVTNVTNVFFVVSLNVLLNQWPSYFQRHDTHVILPWWWVRRSLKTHPPPSAGYMRQWTGSTSV